MNTDNHTPTKQRWTRLISYLLKLSVLRRVVLLLTLGLFLLQFFKMKLLVGGLSGAVALWWVKLIDIFAYAESLVASKDFTPAAFWAVLPIIGLYLLFGRAFCGWICPLDFLFELETKLRFWSDKKLKLSPLIGGNLALIFLATSAWLSIPLFTNYFSHLTNFFRAITGGVFMALDLPVEPKVVLFSGAVILSLLLLEFFFPRLWCTALCPPGIIYGLFNKTGLLKLKFMPGECGACNHCEEVCYMRVKIIPYLDRGSLRDVNCIYCGKCIESCEAKGKIIKLKIGR